MKLLGLDYGDKRIGLAIGDSETKTAVPFLVLENKGRKSVVDELQNIVREESVDRVVVGFPYTAVGKIADFRFSILDCKTTKTNVDVDGEEATLQNENLKNGQGQKVSRFIGYLKENLSVPVVMHDERLSTREADNLLKGHGDLKKNDDVAAMVILQGYLDKEEV